MLSDFVIIIILIILMGTILLISFKKLNKSNDSVVDITNYRPSISDLSEIYKDITIEPYGCFTNIEDKFFLKQINRYRTDKVFDSGMIIDENQVNKDMNTLIDKVLKNGYNIFSNHIINKYNGEYKHIDMIDLGGLAKLAGYNYFTIFKLSEHERHTIYLTYSPPMDSTLPLNYNQQDYNSSLSKSDLPNYTLTPKAGNFANENNLTPEKELSCGFPCYVNGTDELQVFTDSKGVERNYMCGSAVYPTIKTAPRYAVYKIVEIK